MKHNYENVIKFNKLRGVCTLLPGNNIQHIPDNTFSILPNLRVLNIGSNLFNVIPDNALNLPKLETLTLASLNKNGELHGSAIGKNNHNKFII